jgi:outer membrane lipopolysaccharide assembly protein LptE/RlpB
MMNLRTILASALVLQLLAGCGDHAEDTATPTSDERRVPSSALASATAYSQWASLLERTDSDQAYTLDDQMKPPLSESDLPINL